MQALLMCLFVQCQTSFFWLLLCGSCHWWQLQVKMSIWNQFAWAQGHEPRAMSQSPMNSRSQCQRPTAQGSSKWKVIGCQSQLHSVRSSSAWVHGKLCPKRDVLATDQIQFKPQFRSFWPLAAWQLFPKLIMEIGWRTNSKEIFFWNMSPGKMRRFLKTISTFPFGWFPVVGRVFTLKATQILPCWKHWKVWNGDVYVHGE